MAVANAAFGIYVMARSTPNATRDTAPLTLLSSVLASMPHNRWPNTAGDDTASKMPMSIAAVNLYSSKLDSKGISLWCVRWQQGVDLTVTSASDLADMLRVYTTYEPSAPVDMSVVSMVGEQELEATA